jgi:hypothetical protein
MKTETKFTVVMGQCQRCRRRSVVGGEMEMPRPTVDDILEWTCPACGDKRGLAVIASRLGIRTPKAVRRWAIDVGLRSIIPDHYSRYPVAILLEGTERRLEENPGVDWQAFLRAGLKYVGFEERDVEYIMARVRPEKNLLSAGVPAGGASR